MNQTEIAKEIGLSEGRLSQIFSKLISEKTKEVSQNILDSLQIFNVSYKVVWNHWCPKSRRLSTKVKRARYREF